MRWLEGGWGAYRNGGSGEFCEMGGLGMLLDEETTGRETSRDGKLEADEVCDMKVGERSFVRSHKGH